MQDYFSFFNGVKQRFLQRKLCIEFVENKNNCNIFIYKENFTVVYYFLQNNELIGSISGFSKNNEFFIDLVSIDKKYSGKGLGKFFYIYVIEKYKKVISNDIDRSIHAEYIWRSLSKTYNVIKENEIYYIENKS